MGSKSSVWLSDEAAVKLQLLREGLSELSGVEISTSATLTSLIERQALLYLDARRRLAQAVEKYTTGKFGPEAKAQELQQEQDVKILEAVLDARGVSDEAAN